MKKHSIRIVSLTGCVCCAALAFAQDNRGSGSNASRSTPSQATRPEQSAAVKQVRVTRATNFLGSDVIATDGRKVGDIVDYYLDLGDAPRLHYVVIMTGGFLDMGGDRRAVPASAVSMSDEACRIDIASDRFWDVPVLPENHDRFMADAQNRNRISQFFTRAGNPNAPAGQPNAATASANANRAGAPTGRTNANEQNSQEQLVSFNALRNSDAFGAQGTRLGYFADAWINVNDNRAPYVEITPTFQPFRTNYDRRYAIPSAKIGEKREYDNYDIAVTVEDLDKAKPVSETEGVKMLQDGTIGDMVLRVTVAKK